MHSDKYAIVIYIFFWAVRINGCIRRGLQPLRRGRDWFFGIPVPPDFYTGAGRTILRAYWMRMLIPFAIDIPVAVAIFLSGRLQYITLLVLGLSAFIHINHLFSVNLAERKARSLAVPESEKLVTRMTLSLKPRRLRDYTNSKLEWSLVFSSALALALLVRYYFAAPEHHNWRLVFGVPILLLYLQLGMLFVKRVVLAWRTPLPQTQAAEHMEAREETRKYYVKVCDWQRIAISAAILFWPIRLSTSAAGLDRLLSSWFAIWVAISIVSFVWVEIRRQQLLTLALRVRPVKLPDLLEPREIAGWPVCYQPSVPMSIVKGPHGYSLNLANGLTHLGAAYLLGLAALIAFLPKHH